MRACRPSPDAPLADVYRDLAAILRAAGRTLLRPGKGDQEPRDGSRHAANAGLKAAGLPKAF